MIITQKIPNIQHEIFCDVDDLHAYKCDHIIIIIGFLINVQVQGQHPHQWAPFQIAGLLHAVVPQLCTCMSNNALIGTCALSPSRKHAYIILTHFYIVKLEFTGVYIIFFISAEKQTLWVLVRTASLRQS